MNEEDATVPILVMFQTQGDISDSAASLCGGHKSEKQANGNVRCKYSPLQLVKNLLRWFTVMREAFGGPFLGVVMIVYGVSQGYAETVKGLATNYYWKDVQKMQPASTQGFMSLSWGSMAVGGLFGCGVSGAAVHGLGPQGSYVLVSIAPAMLIVAALTLPESRLPKALCNFQFEALTRTLRQFGQTLQDPVIWKPALYIYLSQGSLCPDISEAMFFWLTDPMAGPGFSEEFMGFVNAVGYLAMFVGVAGYNYWFRHYTFRKMFLWPQVMSSFIGLLDIILVTKSNRQMRIPDHLFILGDKACSDAISRVQLMPMLVLSARLCPSGIEGTVFAFLMSVSNFGNTSGSWFGATLLKWLCIQKDDYSRLWLAILIRSLMRLSPLLFLFLVPDCTVESIIPLNIAISDKSGMEQTAKDVELCDTVLVHEADG